MPTALPRPITAATGETRRGTRAWREKAGRWKSRTEADGQGKARTVIAGLREPQTRCVTIIMTKTATASCRMRTGDRPPPATTTGAEDGVRALSHAGHPASLGQGRTGHLYAPHLSDCVNTGSPKRAGFTSPAWRRSRHSSRTLGVMPETASHGWTRTGEIRRAIGGGNPSARVKGGALAGSGNLMTTRGGDAPKVR